MEDKKLYTIFIILHRQICKKKMYTPTKMTCLLHQLLNNVHITSMQ